LTSKNSLQIHYSDGTIVDRSVREVIQDIERRAVKDSVDFKTPSYIPRLESLPLGSFSWDKRPYQVPKLKDKKKLNTKGTGLGLNISKKIKEGLQTYSKDIQDLVDEMLRNKGAITEEQLNELDEKTRQAKFKLLESESSNTFVKYGLYVGVAIFAFGTLWFLTRDKSQTNG
jgi:hypothetical protein